jgi:putative tryptophan/tyrosine transport system substrate-binding protein
MNRRSLLTFGAAATLMPSAAIAQPATRRLGLLVFIPFPPLVDPFIAALGARGWRTGRNLHIETRATAHDQVNASAFAKALLDERVDLIVTVGTANALAARQVSRTIPIVMLGSGFPVEAGLAASLARPGGNVTGLSIYAGGELFGKYVDLLNELVPNLSELGVFWAYAPPAFPEKEAELAIGQLRRAAHASRINLTVWMNRNDGELTANISHARRSAIQALFVTTGGPHSQPGGIAKIVELCRMKRLPTMSDVGGAFFLEGGLLSYSADFRDLGTRAASFVDRIFRGARPGDLPIEQPTKFELLVNRRTAQVLGITIPPSLLARADRIIE